jgi:hypothetical protein
MTHMQGWQNSLLGIFGTSPCGLGLASCLAKLQEMVEFWLEKEKYKRKIYHIGSSLCSLAHVVKGTVFVENVGNARCTGGGPSNLPEPAWVFYSFFFWLHM